ncbi:MAG: exodeoxyribonuclease VII small subunit [Thermacetogeniaceae bacterium]
MDQASEQPQPPTITFEEALARLEAVVAELEKGDLTLAAALEAFKDGISNLSICVQDLNVFEEQIEVLLSEYYASAPAWLGGPEPGGRTK